MKFTKRLVLTPPAASVLLLGGCVSMTTRSADEFMIGYSRDAHYETIVPLIMMWESDGPIGKRRALVVPPDAGVLLGSHIHSAPPSTNPWGPCTDDLRCWVMGDIIAVIPAGTQLKISRIARSRGWNVWYGGVSELTPFALLPRDKEPPVEVDISDLSRDIVRKIKDKSFDVPIPDGELLRVID